MLLVESFDYSDFVDLDSELHLVESFSGDGDNGEKEYYIQGIFAQSNIVNRNGRYYPEHVLDKAMNNYITNSVNKYRAVCECEHPKSSQINLLQIACIIEPNNIKKVGSNWVGRAKVLNTDVGRNIKALIDGGVKFGVSTRALGSTVRDNNIGANVVKDGLEIVAIDVVFTPSAPHAIMSHIKESEDIDVVENLPNMIKEWIQ